MTITLPHTWRPFGVRMAGFVFGSMLLIVCIAAWVLFGPEVRARFTVFQKSTMVFLGLLGFSCWYALVRSRVRADETGVTVVNGYKKRVYEWAEVVHISLRRGAPWATLDLSDGTTVSVMAIQGSDGSRARRALRELRDQIVAHTPTD